MGFMSRYDITLEVLDERKSQDEKWGEQNHGDGTGGVLAKAAEELARTDFEAAERAGKLTWALILREEICEAFAETDEKKLRAELLQVAAVACAWVECIDRRTGK